MKYHGIIISDIHFGAFAPEVLQNELNEIFFKYLDSTKQIDFIVINGDYFDYKIYLNEKISKYAMSTMERLVNLAKDHHCPIRIVYGTEGHEANQYGIFSFYQDDNVDFKIIYQVEEEELLPNLHVLYLPEEHVFSKKDYYGEYFNKKEKYDYVFGHGIIQEVMTNASRSTKEKSSTKQLKVPVFTTSELIEMCKGQIYFGHYHIHTNIMDKIFYVGSYSRWKHDEEKPKGFYHVMYDPEKEKYSQTFIENTLARRYITYRYGYDSKVIENENTLMEELNKRDKETELQDGYHVRYVFNIPENHPNPEFIINVLNERYKFNEAIKVNITNGYVEKKRAVNKKKLNDALNEYPMIFDKSAKIEDKVVYFIKKRFDKDLEVDSVKRYLYQ